MLTASIIHTLGVISIIAGAIVQTRETWPKRRTIPAVLLGIVGMFLMVKAIFLMA